MPTEEEMAQSGFTPEDFVSDPVEIWPDTLAAFNLMVYMGTQWRSDNGPYGLDYAILHAKMNRMDLTPEQFDELEADIQLMETAALKQMRKKP